jgi:alpha-beta hydrolase superfamily lysophospholipase
MGVMARLAVVVRPALVVLVVLALLLALVWLAQRRLIYFPDRSQVPSVTAVLPAASDVTLTTSDGLELGAWYVPPGGPDRRLTVLVAPGNGGNRLGRVPLVRALAGAGFGVFLFDYRGYGGNPGRPTGAGLARDVRAAHDHLVETRGVPADRIIYFGESLGAAVVAELATEREPAGLVLRSPFTDLAAVGAEHYPFLPVGLLLWDRLPVADHVARVAVPTAVVYGTGDSIVPPEQSREVARRAAGPVQVTEIAGADHNDPELFDSPELVAAVVALADQLPS